MERNALESRIEELRHAIVGLRTHLDDTLNEVDQFDKLVGETVDQAREVAMALGGRPAVGRFLPLGWLGIAGLGLLALAIFSPQTLSRWYDDVRRFAMQRGQLIQSEAQRAARVAGAQFRATTQPRASGGAPPAQP